MAVRAREIAIGLRNIALGGGLASWRMWRNPREWAVASTEVLAVWDSLANRKGLTLLNVHEAFRVLDAITVTMSNPPMTAIAGRTVDMLALCQLTRILKPKVAFEIGTLHGEGALHLAMNGAGHVYTLDLPPTVRGTLQTTTIDESHVDDYQAERMAFDGTDCAPHITRLFGDSANFDYSPYNVDLFFIDGAHSYAYVKSDTLKALSCLRAGGTIAWHDFGRRGVNGVSVWLRELNKHVTVYAIPGGSMAFATIADPKALQHRIGGGEQRSEWSEPCPAVPLPVSVEA